MASNDLRNIILERMRGRKEEDDIIAEGSLVDETMETNTVTKIENEEKIEENGTTSLDASVEYTAPSNVQEQSETAPAEEVQEKTITAPVKPVKQEVERPKIMNRNIVIERTEPSKKEAVTVSTDKTVLVSLDSPEEADLYDIKYMITEVAPDAVQDYVVDIAGKPVLTYAGVLRAAVLTGNIECTVEPVEISDRRVIFKARARHLKNNVIVEGIGVVDLDIEEERINRLKEKYKNDPYRMRNYDEQLARLKEYRIQIAFSRAQRNALKYLINEREWAYRFRNMLISK